MNTLLLQVPSAVLAVTCVLLSSWVADRFQGMRCILVNFFLLISLVGALMIRQIDAEQDVARLFGLYLFSLVSCCFPLILSLIASNFAGQTKKTFMNALFFVAYCAGNIVGPQVFLTREAPTYYSAFATMISLTTLNFLLFLILRFVLVRENQKRDAVYGQPNPDTQTESEWASLEEDLTDFEREKSFRYMY